MASDQDDRHPVVLITGASSGIGRELALRYARRGARLVLAARAPRALDKTATRCRKAGADSVVAAPTDVVDREQVHAMIARAVEEHDHVDLVIHAAGVAAYGEFGDIPAEVFDQVVRVNLTGSANVARAALGHFRERGSGDLVLVGSVLGKITAPEMTPYTVGKFGVTALIRALQQETRALSGVRVFGVYPGSVDTPIYRQSANYFGRLGSPPGPTASAETMAASIIRAIDRGDRNLDSPLNLPMVIGFRMLPKVYDAMVGPLLRRLGLSGAPVDASPGNAFSSVNDSAPTRRSAQRKKG